MTHRSRSAPRAVRGQVSVLVVLLTLALAPMVGLVVNVARTVDHRQLAQEAADQAAMASAGATARGLNFVSNANLAVIQLTALITAIDSLNPTLRKARNTLNSEAVAAALIPGAQPVLLKIQQERMVLTIYGTVASLARAIKPFAVQVRSMLVRMIDATIRTLPQVVRAAGLAAGTKAAEGISLRPVVLNRVPTRSVTISRYSERAWEELEVLTKPVFWTLLATVTISGAAFYWKDETEDRFERAIHGAPRLPALTRERDSITQRFVDGGFVHAWRAEGRGGAWTMASVFGAGAPRSEAVAEALVFNPDRWDLITPRWEAALVPVRVAPVSGHFEVHH